MPEIVSAFARTELWHERADCSVETSDSSRGNLAQQCFEFAVRKLDGIEVGRVFRQVANCRVRMTRGRADGADFGAHIFGPPYVPALSSMVESASHNQRAYRALLR